MEDVSVVALKMCALFGAIWIYLMHGSVLMFRLLPFHVHGTEATKTVIP